MFTAQDDGSKGCVAPWYAVYTRHQHEKHAALMLSQKGFETFLPLRCVAHRWNDRVKKLELPLFPSYLFLHGGLNRMLEILRTPGVCWLVETGGHAAVIHDREVEAIKRITEQRLNVEHYPYFESGDYVRVSRGPLEGTEGILVRKKGGGSRFVISVEVLQRAVAVELDASLVERISRHPKGKVLCRVMDNSPPQPSREMNVRAEAPTTGQIIKSKTLE